MSERIQKVLARAGYGSRRQLEGLIREGRISVNGSVVELGTQISSVDKVKIDGTLVNIRLAFEPGRCRVILYHKPTGQVSTRADPEGRPTVYEHLPELKTGRWVGVGRLDINTTGVMLFTTDGDLANHLMHPSSEIEREYAVRVLGDVSQEVILQLKKGVMLDDGFASFDQIRDAGGSGANHWYHVTVREGRNREVRRLWESQGVRVSRLSRVRFGPVVLPRSLRLGKWMDLSTSQIEQLRTKKDDRAKNTSRPEKKRVQSQSYRKNKKKPR